MDRSLQLIGMAKKAGLLAVGGEAVKAALRAGKAWLVILSSDASEGSAKRARSGSELSGAVYVDAPYTKFELGNVTGRGSPGTVAILDIELAAGFLKGLAASDTERYGEIAERLQAMAADKSKRKRRAGI